MMSFRSVKVPPNSASLIEANGRVFNFFRTACRSFATVMDIYTLYEVVTKAQLCSSIASQIRKHSNITNPKIHDVHGKDSYEKPHKSVRTLLFPIGDEQEKHEEGFFGSLSNLFANAGACGVEIFIMLQFFSIYILS